MPVSKFIRSRIAAKPIMYPKRSMTQFLLVPFTLHSLPSPAGPQYPCFSGRIPLSNLSPDLDKARFVPEGKEQGTTIFFPYKGHGDLLRY